MRNNEHPDGDIRKRRRFVARRSAGEAPTSADVHTFPLLLTADETATLLRTTKKAVYAMVERGQLPGVTRLGRRVHGRQDQ